MLATKNSQCKGTKIKQKISRVKAAQTKTTQITCKQRKHSFQYKSGFSLWHYHPVGRCTVSNHTVGVLTSPWQWKVVYTLPKKSQHGHRYSSLNSRMKSASSTSVHIIINLRTVYTLQGDRGIVKSLSLLLLYIKHQQGGMCSVWTNVEEMCLPGSDSSK